MASMNPCENLNQLVDLKIGELEQRGVKLRSQIAAFRDTLKSYTGVASAQAAVDSAISSTSVDQLGAGLDEINKYGNFAGACLDRIMNEARKFADQVNYNISENLDSLTSFVALPEYDLLTPLQNLRGQLGIYDFANILKEIDDYLGCLAEGSGYAECLSSVDNFNARIDDVLAYTGLTSDGELDLDNFVSVFDIDIDTNVLTNLKSMDTQVASLATECVKNVKNAIPFSVNPYSRF